MIGLTIILGSAAVGGLAARIFKQPPILGYLLAGMALAGLGYGGIVRTEGWGGQIGVTLLLFLVGLELPTEDLSRLGRVGLLMGLGEVGVVGGAGVLAAIMAGLRGVGAVLVGLAVSFSSTIVVVKWLAEKKDTGSLYGRLVTVFLLVQDFAAVAVLICLAGWNRGNINWRGGVMMAVLLGVFWTRKFWRNLLAAVDGPSEILLIVALTWCMGLTVLADSPIGGFMAGLSIGAAVQNGQIGVKVKPLRDFFLTVFFVGLGATINWSGLSGWWRLVAVLVWIVVVVKPLAVIAMLKLKKYSLRVAVWGGLTVGQMSEFSLVLVALAVGEHLLQPEMLGVAAAVMVLALVINSYIERNAQGIYALLKKMTGEGEEKNFVLPQSGKRVVLVGHSRTGARILPKLEQMGLGVVVVDFDPNVIATLQQAGVAGICGDIADEGVAQMAGVEGAEMVISTASDVNDNLGLLEYVRKLSVKPRVWMVAADQVDASRLSEKGAAFVVVPSETGGEFLAGMVQAEYAKKGE